jgi:Lectin C-type domain
VYPTANGIWYIGGQSLDPNPATRSAYYWKLSQTEPVETLSYTNWMSGQPDYSQNLDACMAIYVEDGYKWNDVQCGLILCYVCEYRGQPHAFSP